MKSAPTVEQIRAAEDTRRAQLPDGALMERAAAGLASAIVALLGHTAGARVLVLAGGGDNGGDALLAAARLLRRGVTVEAVLLGQNRHAAAFTAAGGRIVDSAGGPRPDVVVDGIVGIGGRPGLRADAEAALAQVAGVPLVAVDVPSGVGVDSGEVGASHVTADVTITVGTHKICHLVDPAATACGAVHLIDLGMVVPEAAVTALGPEDVAAMIPRPGPADHKYTRGVLGVRTGSASYPGAAVLGVGAAAAGLCGMVRYSGGAAEQVRAAHPQVVVGEGRVQAWVVGSGSGDDAEQALRRALEDDVPVVVDADALRFVEPGRGTVVLTPHAGELAALLDLERAEVESAPLRAARAAADRFAATVLLKGNRSLVATPGGQVRVNTTGTAWLGVAGAGDVLAGVIGALLAAGLTPLDAASVGSWLHGAAASYASAGGPLTPGDVVSALAPVVRDLLA